MHRSSTYPTCRASVSARLKRRPHHPAVCITMSKPAEKHPSIRVFLHETGMKHNPIAFFPEHPCTCVLLEHPEYHPKALTFPTASLEPSTKSPFPVTRVIGKNCSSGDVRQRYQA